MRAVFPDHFKRIFRRSMQASELMDLDEVQNTELTRVIQLEKKIDDANGDMSNPVSTILDQADDLQTVRDHYY